MSLENAWKKYSIQNGVYALQDLTSKVRAYRKNTGGDLEGNTIGCILLKDVIFLAERDWFLPPAYWSRCIVLGKTYAIDSESGNYIFENFIKGMNRLASKKSLNAYGLYVHLLYQMDCSLLSGQENNPLS